MIAIPNNKTIDMSVMPSLPALETSSLISGAGLISEYAGSRPALADYRRRSPVVVDERIA